MYPANAPAPIQYQYACVRNPRDFRISTPNDSFEPGRTFNKSRVKSENQSGMNNYKMFEMVQ